MKIFPFLSLHGCSSFLGNHNFFFTINCNKTSCHPIRSVIILVIYRSDFRCTVVRFCYHSYDYSHIELHSVLLLLPIMQDWLRYPDNAETTRDTVMTVLSAVDSILVRATYSTTTTKARSEFNYFDYNISHLILPQYDHL